MLVSAKADPAIKEKSDKRYSIGLNGTNGSKIIFTLLAEIVILYLRFFHSRSPETGLWADFLKGVVLGNLLTPGKTNWYRVLWFFGGISWCIKWEPKQKLGQLRLRHPEVPHHLIQESFFQSLWAALACLDKLWLVEHFFKNASLVLSLQSGVW